MIEQNVCDVRRGREPGAVEDEALALSARGGDREARNRLYLRLVVPIRRRLVPALRLVRYVAASGAPIDARDVEQEAFVIFCDLLAEWEPERTQFVPFMTDMIWRRACKYVRQYQHLRSKRVLIVPMAQVRSLSPEGWQDEDAEEEEPLDGLPYALDRLFVAQGEGSLVELARWDALTGQLRADWRRFVRLRFWEERSTVQIAQWEGCSPRSVNRGLIAALAQLKRQLTEERDAG